MDLAVSTRNIKFDEFSLDAAALQPAGSLQGTCDVRLGQETRNKLLSWVHRIDIVEQAESVPDGDWMEATDSVTLKGFQVDLRDVNELARLACVVGH